jgi:uncharacterized integral membrane protein
MRTLGRLLWLSITLFLVMFAIVFATSNKNLITLYLWPFDSALTSPVWLLILSSFIIGGLLSAILLWGQWLAIRAKLPPSMNTASRIMTSRVNQPHQTN